MKDGIPLVYWAFRNAWTVLHFAIVVVAAVLLISWSLTDGNGARVLRAAGGDLLGLQRGVADAVPYPWS